MTSRRASSASTDAFGASKPLLTVDDQKRLVVEALAFYASAGRVAASLCAIVVAVQVGFLVFALACPSEGHPLCLQALVIGLSTKWIISVLWHPDLRKNWIPHALMICVTAHTLIAMWACLRQPEWWVTSCSAMMASVHIVILGTWFVLTGYKYDHGIDSHGYEMLNEVKHSIRRTKCPLSDSAVDLSFMMGSMGLCVAHDVCSIVFDTDPAHVEEGAIVRFAMVAAYCTGRWGWGWSELSLGQFTIEFSFKIVTVLAATVAVVEAAFVPHVSQAVFIVECVVLGYTAATELATTFNEKLRWSSCVARMFPARRM